MFWMKIARLMAALDKRITDNVAFRGEMWVHDPMPDPLERGPGVGKTNPKAAPSPVRRATRPLRRHGMA